MSLATDPIVNFISTPNWTIQSIVLFLTIVPMAISLFLALYHYNRWRYRPFLFTTILCFLSILVSLFIALGDLFLLIILSIFGYLTFISIGFCINLLFDSVSRETIDYKKMTILGMFSVATIFVSFDPSAFYIDTYPNGDWVIVFGSSFQIVGGLFLIVIGVFFAYYVVKIYLESPNKLKKKALGFCVGGIIIGCVAPASVTVGLHYIIPGIHLIIYSVGMLLTIRVLTSEPRLAYVLPFKVLRLAIIENSGIPLYTKIWGKEEAKVDPMLFSGMMQAIVNFVQESIDKGSVREIHLDEAILLLKQSDKFPVVCVLISTKSTQILRKTLNHFSKRFFKKFAPYFVNPNKIDNFKPTAKLVLDLFPFVPEYD